MGIKDEELELEHRGAQMMENLIGKLFTALYEPTLIAEDVNELNASCYAHLWTKLLEDTLINAL